MKKLLLFTSLLTVKVLLQAQPFGNEWIDYSKTHYKINITGDGIYRISGSVLAANITNLGLIPAKRFILFHNGQTVPMYVSVPPDSFLTANDYIEFYGRKNKGDIDSLLYSSAYNQINPNTSLFTETSVYFLTTNTNLITNPRLVPMTNNITAPPVPVESYFMYLSRDLYPTGQYFQGNYVEVYPNELFKSIYDAGEGYTDSHWFTNSSSVSYPVLTPSVYSSGASAIFRTRYANYSYGDNHNITITLNATPLIHQNANGFHYNNLADTFSASLLNNGSNTILFSESVASQSANQNVVGTVEIEYPRNFDFGGANTFYFKIAKDPVNQKYLEITNFNDNSTQPVLYDLTNGFIYHSVQPPGSTPIKFLISPSTVDRDMYLRSNDGTTFTPVTQMTPINFVNYDNNQGDYVIISPLSLHDLYSGQDQIEQYRQFRDITHGGRYKARSVDIDQLYDQFAFGIQKSPLAIRNFIGYASSGHWSDTLKYVFLVGKGREAKDMRNDANATAQCLVPTFGDPGSDNLLAASRSSDAPRVAIGRLAANTTSQVFDYLGKMQQYEAAQNTYVFNQDIPDKIWQKQILHFSGGTSAYEQVSFSNYVDTFQVTAQDTLWGAHITKHQKQTDQPIDVSESQIIKSQINNGVSWITFFGHSAAGAFDFSIDEPENYTNTGKYPIILSNGCFAGDIHAATPGYSERFVLEGNKGAIAFMATSDLSVSSALFNFSGIFYQNFCDSIYNTSLGLSFKKTYRDALLKFSADDRTQLVAYEMTLHGDPGMRINQYPKPDYAIDAPSVYFYPATVNPGVDTFETNIIVTNLGRAKKDSIAVTIKRTFFDASQNYSPVVVNYRKVVKAPYYIDTVTFRMPTKYSTLGYGENRFEPYVDADYHIDEMAEGNNGLISPVIITIQNDDVIPIYPYEFAIDSFQSGDSLKASTINPFAPLRTYRFQIDTSELFAHPLDEHTITQVGGVLHWAPNIIKKDSTVYYWRVRFDSIGKPWHTSSLIYLAHEYPGWNQSHYFQWQKDNYLNVKLDTDRIFKFPPTINQIHVRTGVADVVGGNVYWESLGYDLNNSNMYRFRMGGCGYYNGGLTFAVIDPISGQPWISLDSCPTDFDKKYWSVHCCGKGPQPAFDFPTTGTNTLVNLPWSKVIKRFIDSIPPGFYVLIYSVNAPPYTSWDTTLVNALQSSLGLQGSAFSSGTNNGPLVFFTKKGNVNQIFYAYTPGFSNPLDTSFTFIAPWNQGNFTSPLIGPALSWGSVHWRYKPFNNQSTDMDSVDIIGVTSSGSETVLFTLDTSQLDKIITGTVIASQYPYLKLRLRTEDDVLRTPTQLNYWRVLYKKAPEAAINPAAHFVVTNPANIGQNFHVEVGLENIAGIKMDSMLTKYILRDAHFNNTISNIRYGPLLPATTMNLTFDYPLTSSSFNGLNKVIIEANPNNDQIEQYHFNNFAEINFNASGDKINPLLDVTFDNQHILSGDIVSAKPNILIMLKDENKFLALNDTNGITVFLKYPGEATPRRMSYDGVIMKFYPADPTNLVKGNKAQVELKPTQLPDGIFELLIQDHDRTGNNSSNTNDRHEGNLFYDYKIDFEVINKPMVTNVLNYPNPFTTSTKFVFTITGSDIPEFMKIQIITIKGTVVKEIMKEELGNLHIGRNITDYAWDGRDQYGDLLANGVYFYRVVTRLDSKQMDHMGESYDKYFKHGFGKMVMVR